jgi:hypothetical protein
MMSYSWGIISGSFLAPYALSLYNKKLGTKGAWAGILSGFITALPPVICKLCSIDASLPLFGKIMDMGYNSIDMESAVAFKVADMLNIPVVAILNVSDNSVKENKSLMSQRSQEERKYRRFVARKIIPQRVEHFAKIMGVEPKGISITSAQKRFGSCSSRGRICFSFNLVQYPDEAIDYVVVHELAHLVELNHSKEFWKTVEKYMPDYKKRRAMLKN